MRINRLFLVPLVLSAMLMEPCPCPAALPPDAIDTARQFAQECLIIEITKVAAKKSGQNGHQDLSYTAKVVKAERSSSSIQAGDTITFTSYAIDPKAANDLDGPVPPPLLKAGWKGKVWLNRAQGGLTIAVHGHSFQEGGS